MKRFRKITSRQYRDLTLQFVPVLLLFLGQLYNYIKNHRYFEFFVIEPDFFFILNVLAIILSIFTIFRLARFYLEIQSIDYIILSVMITGLVLSINMNIIMQRYITPYSMFEQTISTEYFDFYPQRPLMGDVPFSIGILFLIIHAIRVTGWKDINKAMKGFTIFYVYESIVSVIRHTIWAFQMSRIRTADVATVTYEISMPPFQYISILHFTFNNVDLRIFTAIVTVYSIIPFILLLYIYIKVEPIVYNSEIRMSRGIWMVFAIVNIIGRLGSNLLIVGGIANRGPVLATFFQFWTTITFVLTSIIMMFLIFYPESILISDYQIHQAKKLYKFVSEQSTQISDSNSVLDYKQRIVNYVSLLYDQGVLKGLDLDEGTT